MDVPEDEPLVSVVVPNYNGAKTLSRCLESIFAQTYRNLEVVVVDDASTDDSTAIARRYDCLLVELPHNSGPSVARNRGIAASRGEVIFFVDVDVELDPDAIAIAMRILRDNPRYAVVGGIYRTRPMIDDGLIERCQVLHAHYWRKRNEGIVRSGYFSLGALRRSVVDELGGFNEQLGTDYGEDTEYGFRIAARYPMLLTSEILGSHDDDDRLWPILRKRLRRTAALVPLWIALRKEEPGEQAAYRPSQVVAAAFSVAGLPLALVNPILAVVPAVALLWFVLADFGLPRFVRREAGLRYLAPVLILHYLCCLAMVVGIGVGLARWIVDPPFRTQYRMPLSPATSVGGAGPH